MSNPSFFFDSSQLADITKRAPANSGKLVKGCTVCPLKKGIKSPMMNPFGNGAKDIVVVGEAPGGEEDRVGRPFVGPAGREQSKGLAKVGIDVDYDCTVLNVVQCHPDRNKFPSKDIVSNCSLRLERQLEELKPRLIIAGGYHAMNAILEAPFSFTVAKMRGKVIPSFKHNCWVACTYHPSYIIREDRQDIYDLYVRDLKSAVKKLDIPLPRKLDPKNYTLVTDFNEACGLFNRLSFSKEVVCVDIETTGLSPLDDKAKILTVSLCTDPVHAYCIPISYRDIWGSNPLPLIESFKKFMASDCPKTIHNEAFEGWWSRVILGVPIGGYVWDTMNCAHIENEVKGTCSLEFLAFTKFGVQFKKTVNKKDLEAEPLERLAEYNCMDTRHQMWLYLEQKKNVGKEQPIACDVFNHNNSCLIDMKHRGMCVNLDFIRELRDEIAKDLVSTLSQIMALDSVKRFGDKEVKDLKPKTFKVGSNDDICLLLYDYLDAPFIDNLTAKGNISVDKTWIVEIVKAAHEQKLSTANEIDKFVELLLRYRGLAKSQSTYVEKLLKIVDTESVIHPSYMLHTTVTFRSSSQDPNFQNFPKRNEEQKRIRKAFVPRIGDLFIEADFEGAEICVMAMVSKDKFLRQQLEDGVDIHRFWASKLFQKSEEEVEKDERYVSKNGFVFPEFYGSYYVSIAKNTGLQEDLVKSVEELMWEQYSDIRAYQMQKYATYDRYGYVQNPLQFRRHAPMTKNEIINTEIQGTAFLLLLVGCQEAEYEMRRRNLQSVIVNEIHDSILVDTVDEEVEEVVDVLSTCLTKNRYDWMDGVQMKISISVGRDWYEMEEVA